MATEAAKPAPAPADFAVPLDLLKKFRADIRTIPHFPPNYGYIIFDQAMLSTLLRSKEEAVRIELANAIDKYAAAGGELIMVKR